MRLSVEGCVANISLKRPESPSPLSEEWMMKSCATSSRPSAAGMGAALILRNAEANAKGLPHSSAPPPCRQLPDARMWHNFSSSILRSVARGFPAFSAKCSPHIPLPKAVSAISSSSELRHLPDGSAKILLYVPLQ